MNICTAARPNAEKHKDKSCLEGSQERYRPFIRKPRTDVERVRLSAVTEFNLRYEAFDDV